MRRRVATRAGQGRAGQGRAGQGRVFKKILKDFFSCFSSKTFQDFPPCPAVCVCYFEYSSILVLKS